MFCKFVLFSVDDINTQKLYFCTFFLGNFLMQENKLIPLLQIKTVIFNFPFKMQFYSESKQLAPN